MRVVALVSGGKVVYLFKKLKIYLYDLSLGYECCEKLLKLKSRKIWQIHCEKVTFLTIYKILFFET